jgi:hypothetical protein
MVKLTNVTVMVRDRACHTGHGLFLASYSFLVCLKMIAKAIDENLVLFLTILYLARRKLGFDLHDFPQQ